MLTYKAIHENVDQFIKLLKLHEKNHSKEYYLQKREQLGKDRSYYLIILTPLPSISLSSINAKDNSITLMSTESNSDERFNTETVGIFTDIPPSQPALIRALKLQNRAAEVGFDWVDIESIFKKIAEELEEVRAELTNPDKLQGEIGDLIFACINLARHTGIDPETAIQSCNNRFEQRFRYIEQTLHQQGSSLKEANLEEMNKLWEQAKLQE